MKRYFCIRLRVHETTFGTIITACTGVSSESLIIVKKNKTKETLCTGTVCEFTATGAYLCACFPAALTVLVSSKTLLCPYWPCHRRGVSFTWIIFVSWCLYKLNWFYVILFIFTKICASQLRPLHICRPIPFLTFKCRASVHKFFLNVINLTKIAWPWTINQKICSCQIFFFHFRTKGKGIFANFRFSRIPFMYCSFAIHIFMTASWRKRRFPNSQCTSKETFTPSIIYKIIWYHLQIGERMRWLESSNHTLPPVSYTHLDVYKRQFVGQSLF